MLTPVSAHINEIDGNTDCFDDGTLQRFRAADCRYDQTVVVRVSMKVEELYVLFALKTCKDLFNGLFVSAFAEIGYRLKDLFHYTAPQECKMQNY